MTSITKQSDRRAEPAGGADIRAQLGVLHEDVRTLGRQVKELTAQQLRSMGDRAQEFGAAFGDKVRANPIRFVFVAAGIGALAGILLRRR